MVLLLVGVAQAGKLPVPTWDAMPSLAPETVASAKELEKALKPYRVELFEPKERGEALWAWVVFDDRKEEPATWSVSYRYDRDGARFRLSSVKTYDDRGPEAPVVVGEPLPVEFLVDKATLDGDYGPNVCPCFRTIREGWCSVLGGAEHVQLTDFGRERLVAAGALTPWPPLLARIEAADAEEARALLHDNGFVQETGLLRHEAEIRLAELYRSEPPPEPIPMVEERARLQLERDLIGHALAAEAELSARRHSGLVYGLDDTPSGRALAELAETTMPGWPVGIPVTPGTGAPRSSRAELQVTVRPEPPTVAEVSCRSVAKQGTKSVTRTVTVSGEAGSQAAKDRLIQVQREMSALELELQRLGDREQVTDYAVSRDGTVRSGLVTQDSPQHDRIEGRLAALRAEQGQLMEAAVGSLPTEREVTEQVAGDVYEEIRCTARARQDGDLVLGDETMPVDRERSATVSGRRSPGDTEVMQRLEQEAGEAALVSLEKTRWDIGGGMRVLDWMAIDRWILHAGHENAWTPEEREAERQLLRDLYPRAE